MSEATFETRFQAAITHGRYLLAGSSEPGAPLLVGCHGYGENAEAHLKELRRIPGAEENWRLCAVEALHPFYTRAGSIVASWMTSQGRERAIVDNIRYVASVVAELSLEAPPRRLVYAGFSQGVAMAWRAVARAGVPCHGLLALAGDVPPEVANLEQRGLPPVLLGRGRSDTWYDEEKMNADLEVLERLGVTVESSIFDGGHEWGEPYLEAAGAFLDRMLAESS